MERLTFIFWQNINSMHQSAFLKELAVKHDVMLVTMSRGTGRETMGWHEPDLRNVTLLHLVEIDWKSLIRKHACRNSIHIFSGLHAFAPLHHVMLFAMQHSCRVGLYAEPLVMQGAAGLIKQLRGRIDAWRFADRLEFILCIGLDCKQQYLDWGFPSQKLHDWAYVTENFEAPKFERPDGRPFRIIFPASCSKRKGADLLLEAVTTLASDIRFQLVCYSLPPGSLNVFEQKMCQRYSDHPNISLKNFIKNEQVRIAIAEADLMVLPSRFDGWGAVVNEALGVGTPVLVSDRCGSSILVRDNPLLGEIFSPPDISSLREALTRNIREGVPSPMRRKMIRDWADQHISGSVLADHLLCIIHHSSANSLQQTTAPWLRSSSQHLR